MKTDRLVMAIVCGVGDGTQETMLHAAADLPFAFLLHATAWHHDGGAHDADLVHVPIYTYKGRGNFSTGHATRKSVGGFCHQHQHLNAALHERHATMYSCCVLFKHIDGERAVVQAWNVEGRAGLGMAQYPVAKENDMNVACLFQGFKVNAGRG